MKYSTGAAVVVVVGGAVVVVVGIGAAVVVVAVAGGRVVVVVAGGWVVDVSTGPAVVIGACAVLVVGSIVGVAVVCSAGRVVVVVVVVVGKPMATGVSTTRSRIPATAAEAIRTDRAVAPSHAAPIRKYLLIPPSMHHLGSAWVKARLSNDESRVICWGFVAGGVYVSPMASILLIEDDQRIRQTLATRLAERGHDVETTAKAMEGVQLALEGNADVVVLDLGLPDVDGADALQMIRAVSAVPVIVATARDDQDEIVRIFDAGADDYVIKPYSTDHLEARVRALLRRAATADTPTQLEVGELVIDSDAHEATLAGEPLDLSSKEFDLLAYLAERSGKMIGKRELLAAVWRQPYGGADKTVDVHLSWLRKKLGETAAEPRYIHTRRGIGVKLVDPGS